MTKEDLTAWALANGWQIIAGTPSLTKPSAPKEAIVRLIFKTTVVSVEVKKPAGKWEKIVSIGYQSIHPDPEGGIPRGLGLENLPGLSMLMRDNKDRQVFGKMGGAPRR